MLKFDIEGLGDERAGRMHNAVSKGDPDFQAVRRGCRVTPGADAKAGRAPPTRIDGLRVLVVDDEDDARRAMVILLRNAGAVVWAAASVIEAMTQVSTNRPQILVSDIAMPGQDGYDLLRQLRLAGHSGDELPAIALTAFVRDEDREEALAAGFQMHLRKPLNAQDLIAVLARIAGTSCPEQGESGNRGMEFPFGTSDTGQTY